MSEKLSFFLIFYPMLLLSLSFHEAAHAYVANYKGDSTARDLGRITLNPIAHMDLVGTFLLPIIMIFSGAPFLFGWGKPVPVDPRNFKDERRDNLWVAIWGPISNILLAFVFAVFFRFITNVLPVTSISSILVTICYYGVILNLALAFFNLIPIYPLDGQSVLRGVLPERLVPQYDQLMRYGSFFLIFLFISGALKFVAIPISYVARILIPM